MNVVESKMLINLESVERNYLKLRKSGADEALRLVDNSGTVLFPVTRSETCYTNARQPIPSETLKRFSCTGSSLSLFLSIHSKDAETSETIPIAPFKTISSICRRSHGLLSKNHVLLVLYGSMPILEVVTQAGERQETHQLWRGSPRIQHPSLLANFHDAQVTELLGKHPQGIFLKREGPGTDALWRTHIGTSVVTIEGASKCYLQKRKMHEADD